jgi:hypothetical protein
MHVLYQQRSIKSFIICLKYCTVKTVLRGHKMWPHKIGDLLKEVQFIWKFLCQDKIMWFFVSFRNFFSDNTRVRIFIFILSREARILFPGFNIRLYDKNSESDYFFFPLPKSEYFVQQHWESEYFFSGGFSNENKSNKKQKWKKNVLSFPNIFFYYYMQPLPFSCML